MSLQVCCPSRSPAKSYWPRVWSEKFSRSLVESGKSSRGYTKIISAFIETVSGHPSKVDPMHVAGFLQKVDTPKREAAREALRIFYTSTVPSPAHSAVLETVPKEKVLRKKAAAGKPATRRDRTDRHYTKPEVDGSGGYLGANAGPTGIWRAHWLTEYEKMLRRLGTPPVKRRRFLTIVDRYLEANPYPPIFIGIERLRSFVKDHGAPSIKALDLFYTGSHHSKSHADLLAGLQRPVTQRADTARFRSSSVHKDGFRVSTDQ